MNRSRLVLLLVVAGALGAGGAALSCNLMDAVTCDSDEFDLASHTVGNFGSDEASQKIEAFFEATIAVNTKATDLMNRLTTACKNIGAALGLTGTQMEPTGANPTNADRIRAACTPVAAEIRSTIQAALPTGFKLSLTYVPPVCEASFSAYAECAGRCDVTVVPGSLDVDCEPGSIGIGECSAGCTGKCWLAAGAGCTGSCSATCTGTCDGSCYGTCSAGCSYESSAGVCAGTCSGTCTGQCSANCTGECSGTCEIVASGGCTGECHGSCDAWVTPPRCEVYAQPPTVDADCHASCQADVSANLTCTRPSLTVNYGQLGGDATAQAKLGALVTALRDNYPEVLKATIEAGSAVVNMVGTFFDALEGFADSLSAALDAAMCAVVAVGIQVDVGLTFSASASATLDVTGAVAVQGTAM
jgi:hypothetical protein